MDEMKVFILTEGGRNIGFGHITRCTALYQAFEERGIISKFIANGDDSVIDLLYSKDYEIFDWIDEKERLLELIQNVDITIVDSYLADIEIYKTISECVKIPVYLDDNKRLDYPKGIVVNGAIYAEELNYPVKKGVTYLLGSEYMPLRKEFWNVPEKEIKENIESVMITFGGDDVRNMTPGVLRLLKNNFPELIKNVVIGKGFKNIREIEKLKDDKTNLIYYPGAEEMKNIMLESDIAISAAGQTFYELAVTGTPSIAVKIAENQSNNIDEWKKKGLLIDKISFNDTKLMLKLNNQIQKLHSIPIRKKLSNIGKENADVQGARRTVDIIINKVCYEDGFYLRNALPRDSKLVFNLSNNPIVRQYSINRKSIKWEDHKRWFINKIFDNNYTFLLAFNVDDHFMGQVKFQNNIDSSVVSVSISEEFRGKGLAKKLLSAASSSFFYENKSINIVIAYIRPENTISIKSFESVGFKYECEEKIGNEIFKKYLLRKPDNEN